MRQNITIALQPESQPIHQHNAHDYAFVDILNSKLVVISGKVKSIDVEGY